jgi:hypothetical protein
MSDQLEFSLTRRSFMGLPLLLAMRGIRLPVLLRASTEHPDPRPGITAEHVLPANHFKKASVGKSYDMAREIPEVLDGLHCYCECSESMGHRSLLSCFESEQPSGCWSCNEQMKLAHKLHGEGKNLDEIRKAIDLRFA